MMIVEAVETKVFRRLTAIPSQKPPHDPPAHTPAPQAREIRTAVDIEVPPGRLALGPVRDAAGLVGKERREVTLGIPALPELLWIRTWVALVPRLADLVLSHAREGQTHF
jgi:hypothetical protein